MRTRYCSLLSISILTVLYLLGTPHPSFGQRPKTQPSQKAKAIESVPAVKIPDSTGTFPEVLRKAASRCSRRIFVIANNKESELSS